MTKLLKKRNNLEKILVIKTEYLDRYGLNRTDIHRLSKENKLEHVARGVYLNKEEIDNIPFQFSDLFYTALSIKHGVICSISALSYYDLTDEMPRKFYIAIPSQNKPSANKRVKFYRVKNYDLGIEEIKISESISVKIYSKERCVVEAFKFLTIEIAIKALRNYLRNNNPDINKIMYYAKVFKVKIEPYIQTILTDDR